MAISIDLRQRVLADHQAGMPNTQIAKKYTVSRSSVERWIARFAATGSLVPLSPPGRTPLIDERARNLLRKWLAEENDLTLIQLQQRWDEQGYSVALSTVGEWLDRLKLSYKKNDARQRTRPPRCSGAAG